MDRIQGVGVIQDRQVQWSAILLWGTAGATFAQACCTSGYLTVDAKAILVLGFALTAVQTADHRSGPRSWTRPDCTRIPQSVVSGRSAFVHE